MSLCDHCGYTGATARCSRCQKAIYCNKDCQRAAWRAHKPECVKDARSDPEVDALGAALDAASNQYVNTCGLYRRAATLEPDPAKRQQLQAMADEAIDCAEQTLDYKDAMKTTRMDEARTQEICASAQKSIDQAEACLTGYNAAAAAAAGAGAGVGAPQ